MARPIKQGLSYFPFDVSFFSDRKVRKIIRGCGPGSPTILICLLCNIYEDQGYYILWDEELPFDIADTVGVPEGTVKELIKKAVDVDFFDKEMFEKEHILTSRGIQSRFIESTRKRKDVTIKKEYWIISGDNSVNDVNNPVNDVNNEQRKEKKRKETEFLFDSSLRSESQINSSSPLTPHGGTDAASSGGGGNILNYYDLTPPADGIDRNFEALARRCKGLGVPESDFKAICRLTNYGRIGDKVWMILRDVEQRKGEIKATGRYLTSLLLKEG